MYSILSIRISLSAFLAKISLRHIIEFLAYVELILCIPIKNEDGCPYTFDMGNKGYDYIKPQSCFSLLPENYTIPSQNQSQQNNGSMWGQPNPFDPYTLRMMYTPSPNIFLIYIAYPVRVDSVDPTTPINELYVEVRRISRMGKLGKRIGFFEAATDYEGFCCEDSKLQCMFHRPPVPGAPIYTTSVRWVPLRFPKGEVVIRANVFASTEEWYANITSRRYIFPGWGLLMREQATRYILINRTVKRTKRPRNNN